MGARGRGNVRKRGGELPVCCTRGQPNWPIPDCQIRRTRVNRFPQVSPKQTIQIRRFLTVNGSIGIVLKSELKCLSRQDLTPCLIEIWITH
ncbi:unnamed protein product, partial [Nesidiocoris tenuis]